MKLKKFKHLLSLEAFIIGFMIGALIALNLGYAMGLLMRGQP